MYPNDRLKTWFDGKGHWGDVSDADWNDWRWQMRNCLRSESDLKKFLDLTTDEKKGLSIAQTKLSFAVTPYFFNLIDPNDPNCPIRKQVIPTTDESTVDPSELIDPVGEEASMAAPEWFIATQTEFCYSLQIDALLTVVIVLEVEWFPMPKGMGLAHNLSSL